MRGHARTDANQGEIAEYLRKRGASVHVTSMVGKGFPDLCCGYRGFDFYIEVKDGSKPPSERQLTKDQKAWFAAWKGSPFVCESIEHAEAVLKSFDERIVDL